MFEEIKAILAGAKATGALSAKALRVAGKVIAAHPVAASRVAGGLTAVSGIKDLKSYIEGEDRSFGTLLKGIAKTAIGTGFVIFNDSSWYEKNGKILPAININRPMNAIYNTSITRDATHGGLPKMVDVYMEWDDITNSLAFNTSMELYFRAIRENLKSNLPYDLNFLKDYVKDSIAASILAAQVIRHLSMYRVSMEQFPSFYKLYNTYPGSSQGYGPTNLIVNDEYSDSTKIAANIALYDTISQAFSSLVTVPGDTANFINHYFCNVFTTDSDDSNTQFIQLKLNTVHVSEGMATFLGLAEDNYDLDVRELSIATLRDMLDYIIQTYGIIAADINKIGTFSRVILPQYDMLQPTFVYSQEVLQALVNAYTPEATSFVTDNAFIRLDSLVKDSSSSLTTFIMLGNLQIVDDPLYTPLLRPISMLIKIESNSDIRWDSTLFAPSFNTTENFGLLINSHITSGTTATVDTNTDIHSLTFTENVGYVADIAGNDLRIDIQNTAKFYQRNYNAYTKGGVAVTSGWTSYSGNLVPLSYVGIRRTGVTTAAYLLCAYGTGLGLNYSSVGLYLVPVTYFQGFTNILTALPYVVVVNATAEDMSTWIAVTSSVIDHPEVTEPVVSRVIVDNTKLKVALNYASLNTQEVVEYVASRPIALGDAIDIQLAESSLSTVVGVSTKTDIIDTDSSIQTLYPGLAAYACEILDFHLPIFHEVSNELILNGDTINEYNGVDLLKESYVPFWYNLYDLNPISYSMIFSLLMPHHGVTKTTLEEGASTGTRKKKRYSRNKKQGNK